MFNNLIESSPHTREFKRRGSFVLFTTATYVLFFIVAGVASIYAYDARLEEPNNEMVITMLPTELPAAPAPAAHPVATTSDRGGRTTESVRQVAMATVDHPELVPKGTSATPNKNLPIPNGRYRIGAVDSDPAIPGGHGDHFGSPDGSPGPSGTSIDVGTPPPAQPPVPHTPPRVISKGPITGLAIFLPKPAYSPIAKQAGAHGAVIVQVLVDETGRVVSAKAMSGHPLLIAAAQQAALRARFSPTRLGDQAVKVSGVITYNFVLQ